VGSQPAEQLEPAPLVTDSLPLLGLALGLVAKAGVVRCGGGQVDRLLDRSLLTELEIDPRP